MVGSSSTTFISLMMVVRTATEVMSKECHLKTSALLEIEGLHCEALAACPTVREKICYFETGEWEHCSRVCGVDTTDYVCYTLCPDMECKDITVVTSTTTEQPPAATTSTSAAGEHPNTQPKCSDVTDTDIHSCTCTPALIAAAVLLWILFIFEMGGILFVRCHIGMYCCFHRLSIWRRFISAPNERETLVQTLHSIRTEFRDFQAEIMTELRRRPSGLSAVNVHQNPSSQDPSEHDGALMQV